MSQQQASEKGKIARSDVFYSWLRWLFFSHANYNWERYQGTGFAHAMANVIRKLYTDTDEIRAALKRHLVFFNTEPDTGGVIHGMVIALEERRALEGVEFDDEMITNIKVGLMGPFAGLGDTLKQGLWFPIWLSIGISVALDNAGDAASILGPIIFVLASMAYTWPFGWWLYWQGFVQGQTLVTRMLQTRLLDQVRTGAAVVGAAVLAALGAQFVTVTTGLTIQVTGGSGADAVVSTFSIQEDLFNALYPSLLPLLTIVGLVYALRRGISVVELVLYLFGICFGSALIESMTRYVIVENHAFGLFLNADAIPTIIGIVILIACAYLAGYRRNNIRGATNFTIAFLVILVIAAVLSTRRTDPIMLLAHW